MVTRIDIMGFDLLPQINSTTLSYTGGGGEEKRSGTEKRCSHNLQSAHLGQRRICDLTAGLFSEVE